MITNMTSVQRIPGFLNRLRACGGLIFILLHCSWSTYGQTSFAPLPDLTQTTLNTFAGALVSPASGVTISNVVYTGNIQSAGTFNSSTPGTIGLSKGILLSTGNVSNANGPNDIANSEGTSLGLPGDALLSSILNSTTYDASALQFDFVATGNKVTFRYVFASEEYGKFVCSTVNDGFGFFVSGPGISGIKNISEVKDPASNQYYPVSINRVNNGTPGSEGVAANCQQPVITSAFNTASATAGMQSSVQYDGYTNVLTAELNVTPCATYRIRIVIADAYDGKFDSGVLIEAGSFSLDAVSITAAGSGTGVICQGESKALSLPSGYTSYQWKKDNIHITGATERTYSAALAGDYSVTFKRNSCAADENTPVLKLAVNPLPVKTVTASKTSMCTAGAATLSSDQATGSYLWTPGNQATKSISVTQAGTYAVTVTKDGCSATSEPVVISGNTLTLTTVSGNVSCYGGNDGNISITPAGGKEPYTVSWTGPAGAIGSTSFNLSGIAAAGTYTATVTDANGCVKTQATVITIPAVLAATVSTAGTGSAQITVSGGTLPYTYSWKNSAGIEAGTGAQVTGLSAGIYSVVVTDSKGCTVSKTATVTSGCTLVLETQVSPALCSGTATGSAVLTVTGGSGTYTYSWTQAANTVSTSKDLGNAAAGTYKIDVVDPSNGCRQGVFVQVTEPEFSVAVSATGEKCSGSANGSVHSQVSGGIAPLSYSWKNGTNQEVGATADVANLAPGSYTVTVTDANQCHVSATTGIGGAGALDVTLVKQDITCSGKGDGKIDMTIHGGTFPYTIQWSGPSGFTSASEDLAALVQGQYTVTVTDANQCISTITSGGSIAISEPGLLTASAVQGTVRGSANLTVTGGTVPYSYIWSNGETVQNPNKLLDGQTYTVAVTDAHGCTASASVKMSNGCKLSARELTHLDVACNGLATGSVALGISGGNGSYQYSWKNNQGAVVSTLANPADLFAGSYIITITDPVDACQITYQTTIAQPSALALTANKTDISCHGLTDGTITTQVSGGSLPYQSYSWMKNNSPFSSNQNLTGLAAGSYAYTVTDNKGCTAVSTQSIIEPALLQASTQATAALCYQGNSGQIALTVTGGWQPYTYVWTATSAYTTAFSSSEGSITNLYAGAYHATATDARNCQATADAVVSEPASGVSASIQSQVNVSCFGGNNGSVQVAASGGAGPYTYVWKQFGNVLATGSTLQNQSSLKAGAYTLTASDSKGCSKDLTVTITEPSGPEITYTDKLSFCEGLSAQLHATAGYSSYQWLKNGTVIAAATGSAYTASTAGKYTVRVTRAASSCVEISKEVYITVNTKPVVTIVIEGNRTEFCEGSSLTLNSSFQGTAYSWKKNGNEFNTSPSVTINETGDYTLVTKTRLCDNIQAQVHLTKYPNFTLTTGSTPASCPGAATGSITAAATGAQAPVNYNWAHLAPASDPASVSNVAAGSYSVLVTDRAGCMQTGFVQVQQPTLTVQPTLTQINCNGGNTGKIALQVSYTPVTGTTTPGTANCYTGAGPGIDCTGGFNISGSNWVDISGKTKICIPAGQTFSGSFNSLTAGQTLVICGSYTAPMINLSGGTVIILGSLQSSSSLNISSNVLIKNYGTMTVTDINSNAGCSLENYGALTITGNINNTISLSNYGQMAVSSTLGMNGTSSLLNYCTLQVSQNMNVNSAVTNSGSITVAKKLTINTGAVFTAAPGSVTQVNDFRFNSGTIAGPAGSAAQIKISRFSTIYSNAITGKLDICDANGIDTLTVTLPAAVTTNCSTPGGGPVSCATTWSNNTTGNTLSNLTAGSYTATITCGACTNTYTYEITQPGAISITTQSTPVTCQGQSTGSIQSTVTGGTAPYTYSWSNGAATAALSNIGAGSYTLSVTDAKSCSKTGSPVVLTAPAALLVNVTSQAASCRGNSDGTATAQVTGGSAPYTYVWSGSSQAGSTAGGFAKGIVTVTVTDTRGCSVQGHTAVSENDIACNSCPGFSAAVRGVNTTCVTGTDGSVYVTVSGGRAPYTYQWSNQAAAGSSVLSGLGAGSYTVTVRDQDNCSYSGSATVAAGTAICPQKCRLIVSLSAVSPTCPGGTGSIQGTVTGGSGNYTYRWNNSSESSQPAILSNLKAGSYSLQVQDTQVENCAFTSTAQIVIPAPLSVFASAYQVCPGQVLTLTSSYGSGSSWSTGSADRSIRVTAAGSYTLTVAGASGCAAQSITTDIAAGDCSKVPVICGAQEGKTIVIENTCQSDQLAIASSNARYSYEQYLDAVKKDFQERYIAKCLNVYENFSLDYSDKEHHRTLYYYDQAGNLVRTIPPEGVNLIPADKLAQVKQDRKNNTRSVFTDHGYATTYTYNSLNQLVAQNMPDHNTMAISDKEQSNTGLPAGLEVTGTQFTGNGNGFLTANDPGTGNGQIYFTKDAGKSWQPLGAIGTMTLNDVELIGTAAYAIGNEGTFLKSTDGGASWIVRPVGTTAALKWMHFSTAAAGIIYQADGTALTTENGGDSWTPVTGANSLAGIVAAGSGLTVTDIYFNGTAEAYATLSNTTAGSGYILKSSDGGKTWFAETVLRSVDLNAVQMLSTTTGYAGGIDGTLLKTTNSGTNWQQIATGQTAAFEWIRFRSDNAEQGIALQGTSLLSTQDGGKSWTGVPSAANVKAIEIAADNTGYYVQANNTLHYTANGGLSWTLKALPPALDFTAVGHSGSNVFVGTANGKVWMSNNVNNALNWKQAATASVPATAIKSIHARSQSSVTIELADGSLYTSTNADAVSGTNSAATWNPAAGLSTGVKTLTFNDADKGYALTTGNTIYTTTTGGESWTAVATLTGTIAAISAADDTHLTAVGAAGAIYSQGGSTVFTDNSTKITAVALSGVAASGSTATAVGADGRVYALSSGTWKQQQTTSRTQLNDVAQNSTGAAATGAGGTILYSNAGAWTQAAATTAENLLTVSLSGTAYYAAGDNGTLLTSANSGASWTTMPSGTTANLKALAFSSTIGLGVGSMGTIIRTESGTNWAPVNNTESKQLYASVMVDNTTGFAVGQNGVVIKTTTGGDTWKNLNAGTNRSLRAVAFSDLTHGIVAGDNGTLKRTENGGLDNFNKPVSISATNITFTDVQMVTAQLAFAVGYSSSNAGVVYQTSNGGQSWMQLSLTPAPNKLNAVYFVDASMGFVVGDNGTVYKAKASGTAYSWDQITDPDFGTKNIHDVHFVDYKTGYVIGDNGLILKTTDGGELNTWGSENLLATTNDLKHITARDRTDLVFSGTGSNVTNVHDETDMYSTKIWYDELGRALISQNAKQYGFSPKGYSYTLCDERGRITEVGEVTTAALVTGYTANNNSNQIKTAQMLTWLATGTKREITRTYYDHVKYPVAGFSQERLRNRVASTTYQKEEGTAYDHATHYSYGIHGNVKSLIQDIPALASLIVSQQYTRIDYDYDLISGNLNQVIFQANKSDQFMQRYDYNVDNWITRVETSSDGVIWDTDAKYFYYDHGSLARTETGDLKVQGMDYAYTIQGWIKGVNSNALSSNTDIGNDGLTGSLNAHVGTDAFGYSLNYFVNDYKAIMTLSPVNNFITGTANVSDVVAGTSADKRSLYNGNISSMVTTIIDPDQIDTQLPQLTAYKYDQLNRIIKLDAYRNINLATNSWTDAATNDAYQERYSYDANGNIKTLTRNGNGAAQMDNLTYHYEGPAVDAAFSKKNNRLSWVDDAVGAANFATDLDDQAAKNYSYDAIGNLIKDNQEEIAEIKWTVFGKVSEVIRTPTSNKPNLEFKYDATGNRIMKILKPKNSLTDPSGWTKTYYALDAAGNEMSTYEERPTLNDGHYTLTEQHIYGSSRTGIRSIYKDLISINIHAVNTYTRMLGEKRYEGTNHLGNVLTVFSDRKNGVDLNKPKLVQSSDYYAFGMVMPGRTFTSSSGYRYGFNGKAQDVEGMGGGGSTYDYGFRIYNPQIAKFLSVDPYTSKYPWYTPYQFAGNKPIWAIDLDGLEECPSCDRYVDWRAAELAAGKDASFEQVMRMYNQIHYRGPLTLEEIHMTLDAAGFIPVIGEVADGVNAIIYISEGDYGNAAISGIAIIPIVGDAGKVGKYTFKAIDLVVGTGRTFRSTQKAQEFLVLLNKYGDKVAGAIWDSGKGGSNKLRDALNTGAQLFSTTKWQAHHLIPSELIEKNATVREAINQGFDFNGTVNGIALDLSRHSGSHPVYTQLVEKFINNIKNANPTMAAKEIVEKAANQAKDYIQATTAKLN